MKSKRVQCDQCEYFRFADLDDHGLTIGKAECILRNRIMFRIPTLSIIEDQNHWGWIRYCNQFEQNETT